MNDNLNNYNFLDAIGMIDDNMIQEAKQTEYISRHMIWKKWIAAAAICLVCFVVSAPVLAATIPSFYQMLYSFSPETAQFFKPVQMSCETGGVCMEVEAVYIYENTAEIYISMQDKVGGRFDKTTDLFDSYSINMPYAGVGSCQKIDYNDTTNTVTFLVTIEQFTVEPWEKRSIEGEKVTFSVREFISNKKAFYGVISNVDLTLTEKEATTQSVSPRGKSYSSQDIKEEIPNIGLKSTQNIATVTEGIAITGIGYVGDKLHVQAYYENIFETDNHGFVALQNKTTGEVVNCMGSLAFFDNRKEGSYYDYIFENVKYEDLQEYELYGEFVTSDGKVEGNWSVTFPLENLERD